MDRHESTSVIQRFLTCRDICRDDCYGHCETCRYNTEYDEKTEALKLAIKALEGKDIDVSTNSALDHIHNVVAENEYKRGYKEGYEHGKADADAETRLMSLPTVQPKDGHWILDRSGAYCCSECMEPCATYAMMRPRDKFCKMCGARMEG